MKLNEYVEHTLLKQDAKKEEIIKLAQEAKEHKFKGVCVNSCNITIVKEILKNKGDISKFVPTPVYEYLTEKYIEKN